MAINILDNGTYTFSPSTNTVVINKWIPAEDLTRIVNATSGGVLYDPTSFETKASNYTASSSARTTTIVLFKNCATMRSTDDLQIYVDDSTISTVSPEAALDPVDRLRVSQIQSLIDSDFEYGLQQGKWENLGMTNNRPYAYTNSTNLVSSVSGLASTAGSRVVTVTASMGHGVNKGDVISVQDSYYSQANGVFTVDTTPNIGTFTYTARSAFRDTITNFFDSSKTTVYKGSYYTGSQIPGTNTFAYSTTSGSSVSLTGVVTNSTTAVTLGAPNTNLVAGQLITGTNIVSSPPTYITSVAANYLSFTISQAATGSGTNTATAVSTSTTVTVTNSTNAHNLSIGNEIEVDGITGSNPPNGSFVVTGVLSPSVFTYVFPSTATVTSTASAAIYSRSQGLVVHRPIDGGVQFSANAASNYEAQIRQTRRYFRYQAGKGIAMSAGIVLKPNIAVDSIKQENSPQGIVVTTKEQHNIQPGTKVTISGADIVDGNDVNNTYVVSAVFGANILFIGPLDNALPTFTGKFVTGQFTLSVSSWYGAANKVGIFDQQNGPHWDFDGQTLSVVRRNSTYQIAGRVTVTKDSNTITGSSIFAPQFTTQLKPGDYIVIRGSSYRVDAIASDTSLTISPSYRGPNASEVTVSKTLETRIAQSSFNLDKLDGTGPSGYSIDLSKMQMLYVDYSWYGAGSIRWGVRDASGKIIYAHKMVNNNANYEAYMRSGNLPARYETVTNPPKTYSIDGFTSGSIATLNVASTTGFPPTGTLVVKGQSVTEFVNYTGLTATSFINLTRGQVGSTTLTATGTVNPSALYGSFSVLDTTGLQVGQRIVARSNICSYPDNTYITKISGSSITTSQLLTGNAGTTDFVAIPMGATAGTIAASASAPIAVELAYPSYSPNLSHWGTSVVMENLKQDDPVAQINYTQTVTKQYPASTVVTAATATGGAAATSGVITLGTAAVLQVGQTIKISGGTGSLSSSAPTIITAVAANQLSFTISPVAPVVLAGGVTVTATSPTYAMMSIRLAPSVDNGIPTNFGVRDLINRAQLVLQNLNMNASSAGNAYITLVLNAKIVNAATGTGTTWSTVPSTSNSIVQYADHTSNGVIPGSWSGDGTTNTHVVGGDVLAGFYFTGTSNLYDISKLPVLTNSILGGGSTTTADGFYPDGPDTLTVCIRNYNTSSPINASASLSWNEAQG